MPVHLIAPPPNSPQRATAETLKAFQHSVYGCAAKECSGIQMILGVSGSGGDKLQS